MCVAECVLTLIRCYFVEAGDVAPARGRVFDGWEVDVMGRREARATELVQPRPWGKRLTKSRRFLELLSDETFGIIVGFLIARILYVLEVF